MAAPTTETRPVATVFETPALVLCCAGWLDVAEAEEELWDELLDAADADEDADAAAEVALALILLMTELSVEAAEVKLDVATTASLPWA
jgi:hypothetical protein